MRPPPRAILPPFPFRNHHPPVAPEPGASIRGGGAGGSLLGQGLMTRARRRRRWGLRITVGFLVVAAAGVWSTAFFLIRPSGAPRPMPPTVAPSPVVTLAPDEELPVFARAAGVALHLASEDVVAVAFHEASMDDAMALRPTGFCIVCRNGTKFEPPPPIEPEVEYLVLDSRGRSQAATSAADLVMPRRTEVLSPVSGTVVDVKRYRLYYRHPDVRIEIRPDDAPDNRVVVIHLEQVKLEEGQDVEASVTPLGTVRRFPFESQVDRYVRGTLPHVHMEVKSPAPRGKDKGKDKDKKG
jgi:hypothetical protein